MKNGSYSSEIDINGLFTGGGSYSPYNLNSYVTFIKMWN